MPRIVPSEHQTKRVKLPAMVIERHGSGTRSYLKLSYWTFRQVSIPPNGDFRDVQVHGRARSADLFPELDVEELKRKLKQDSELGEFSLQALTVIRTRLFLLSLSG